MLIFIIFSVYVLKKCNILILNNIKQQEINIYSYNIVLLTRHLISCILFKYRLEKENSELRRQRDTATDEANALQLQVERRDTEIERMRTELSSLSSQLQTAIATKCQTLAQTEEIRSREMTLDFK